MRGSGTGVVDILGAVLVLAGVPAFVFAVVVGAGRASGFGLAIAARYFAGSGTGVCFTGGVAGFGAFTAFLLAMSLDG